MHLLLTILHSRHGAVRCHKVFHNLKNFVGKINRQMDFLNNQEAAFYAASMILSIEYLHSLKIVYRDIKPENVMVNEFGQLRLIDMGTAKVSRAEAVGNMDAKLNNPMVSHSKY